jgi:hypothetical protein
MPMQPIHRLTHLAKRSDGGVEWACPQCGRYLIRYPDSDLVLAAESQPEGAEAAASLDGGELAVVADQHHLRASTVGVL